MSFCFFYYQNIISISCLTRNGFTLSLENNSYSIHRKNKLFAFANMLNDLYLLDVAYDVYPVDQSPDDKCVNKAYLWHCRLGHINENRIIKLQKNGYLNLFNYEPFVNCKSCLMRKMTKAPFTGHGERAKDLLELIHTYVCGPMFKHAMGGYSYFITFIDDFSKFGYIYLMKYKSEIFEKFKEFKNKVKK